MPPAVAAAGIVAAGTIGGAVLGASSQKKAAKQAASAETQAAQMNIDAAKEFRAENQANFQPFLNSGTRANSLIDSFLYGPAPANYYTGAPAAQAPATGVQTNPVAAQTPLPQAQFTPARTFDGFAGTLQKAALEHDRNDLALPTTGPGIGRNPMLGGLHGGNGVPAQPGGGGGVTTPNPNPAPAGGGGTATSPSSGYAAFINSPYYQFGQQEGMRALNGGLASRGMLESGDAIKSAIRFGQDYGYSQGLMPYLGLAENQTNRGVQSAGGIAGVGLNALNTISASNTASGNAIANSALARGAANSNMYAGIGSALGSFAGSAFGGSSYRGF